MSYSIQKLKDYFRSHRLELAEAAIRDQNFEMGDMFNLYLELTGQSGISGGREISNLTGYNSRVLETYGRVARRVGGEFRQKSCNWSVFVYMASDLNPSALAVDEQTFVQALSSALEEIKIRGYTASDLKRNHLGASLLEKMIR